MADQPSIFNEEVKEQETPATKVDQQSTPPQPNPLEDLLKGIVNDKGEQKYASVQDALYALKHSQEYIPKLKNELSEEQRERERLLAENEKVRELEEAVLQLTQRQSEASTNAQTLNPDDIAKVVKDQIERDRLEASYRTNQGEVVQNLQRTYGEKAEEVFNAKAQELGISVQEMNALAAKSPKAVLTMLGVSGQAVHRQANIAPTSGSINSAGLRQATESFVGRSQTSVKVGATTADLHAAFSDSKKMVEELHEAGYSVRDLSDPKVYFSRFK